MYTLQITTLAAAQNRNGSCASNKVPGAVDAKLPPKLRAAAAKPIVTLNVRINALIVILCLNYHLALFDLFNS